MSVLVPKHVDQEKSKKICRRPKEFSEELKTMFPSLKIEGTMTLKMLDFSTLFVSMEMYLGNY